MEPQKETVPMIALAPLNRGDRVVSPGNKFLAQPQEVKSMIRAKVARLENDKQMPLNYNRTDMQAETASMPAATSNRRTRRRDMTADDTGQ